MVIQFAFPMPPGCGGCCPELFCHDLYGDTLPVTTSGITTCGGCYNDGLNDYDWVITNINASFDLIWNTVNQWDAFQGSVRVNKYSSNDGTCVDQIDFQDVAIFWTMQCTGDNQFTATGGLVSNPFGFSLAVYASSGAVGPGVAQNSSIVIGSCGPGGAGAYGGAITADV